MDRYQETFNSFRSQWALTHRPPKRERPALINFIQFVLFSPIFVIGPLVSAFRTAALISAHTAFPQSPEAVAIETLLGTVFMEWGVIAHQVERLRRLNHKKMKVGTGLIWFGLVSAIGSVAVSNVVQIGITAIKDAGVTWTTAAGVDMMKVIPAVFIALFYGLGVIIMTTVAGEVVGRFVIEYQSAAARCAADYQKALGKWEAELRTAWDRRKSKLLDASHDVSHKTHGVKDATHDAKTFRKQCTQCDFVARSPQEFAAHVRWKHAHHAPDNGHNAPDMRLPGPQVTTWAHDEVAEMLQKEQS